MEKNDAIEMSKLPKNIQQPPFAKPALFCILFWHREQAFLFEFVFQVNCHFHLSVKSVETPPCALRRCRQFYRN